MPTPQPPLEIPVSQTDLQALAEQFSSNLTVLSPFELGGTPPAGIANPYLVDVNGQLHARIRPMIQTLCAPRSAVGFTAVGPAGIIDLISYQDLDGAPAALVHADNALWLQNRTPLEHILHWIQESWGAAGPVPLPVDLVFTLGEALVFWGLVDLLHDNPEQVLIDIPRLSLQLNQPMEGLKWLGAYFREGLKVPPPGPNDINSACHTLARRGVITQAGQGYQAGPWLSQFAAAFQSIRWHMVIKCALDNPPEISAVKLWFFQAETGAGLRWYRSGDTVIVKSVSLIEAMTAVQTLLEHPLGALGQDRPAEVDPLFSRRSSTEVDPLFSRRPPVEVDPLFSRQPPAAVPPPQPVPVKRSTATWVIPLAIILGVACVCAVLFVLNRLAYLNF